MAAKSTTITQVPTSMSERTYFVKVIDYLLQIKLMFYTNIFTILYIYAYLQNNS